jgi:hypothetical protein
MFDKSIKTDNEVGQPSRRSLVGKIARLPNDIREQLNQRLLDGWLIAKILSWLNGLPPVREILAAQFDAAPINKQNLSNWRQTGYQDWLKEWKSIARIERASKYASKITRAGRGKIAAGAATVISGQILEIFDSASTGQHSPNDLAKMAFAVSALQKADQNQIRLKYEQTRVYQGNERLVLSWDMHLRDCVAIAQRVLNDALAKEIQDSDLDNSEKIELLGHHLFAKQWRKRELPVSEPPASNQKPPENPIPKS